MKSTDNRRLNVFLLIADADYALGNLVSFDAVLAAIERQFCPLSIIPGC